jgi:Mrp family chromosome partitioning ATPase
VGEIADAIRRARSQQRAGEAGLPFPGLAPAPAPARPPFAVLGEPASSPASPEHWTETFDPENDAVVLDDGPHGEICRQLALRVREALDQRNARSLAIVSAEQGDGKTTLACNLAIALATLSRGRDVALVDLDLRRPSIARQLSLPQQQIGIEEVLRRASSLDDIRLKVRKPAIDIYPAISPHRAAHELLVTAELRELLSELERRYTTVIIDTPPVPLVPDASLALRHVSTCIAVARVGKTRMRSFRRLLKGLPQDRLVGWILNCDRASSVGADYYYGAEPPPRAKWRLGWSGPQ